MPRMIFALRGMLEAYPMAQLVEEVLVAWNELMTRNEEVVGLSQRVRVLELDLADRRMASHLNGRLWRRQSNPCGRRRPKRFTLNGFCRMQGPRMRRCVQANQQRMLKLSGVKWIV